MGNKCVFVYLQAGKLGYSLKMCLDMLRKVYTVNREAAMQKVGHEVFYIPELTDKVEIKRDYLKWLVDPPANKVFLIELLFLIIEIRLF